MSDALLPRRSQDGLAALDIFYDDFNDVHFFVEDEDQENLYEIIFRRMFPEFRISRIFPLGGKMAVIDHSTQSELRADAPRSIYLVDKDFDDILGCMERVPSLFYLERYCIENYFVEENAVVEIVVENQPRLKRSDIARDLELIRMLPELIESVRPLFQLFYCVQRFNLGIKNCALPAERFCSETHRWIVEPAALSKYEAEVVLAASSTEHAAALAKPLAHPDVARLTAMDAHVVISGKHICTLFFHYLKSKYKLGAMTFESFVFRLAKNSSMQPLSSLAGSIRQFLAKPIA